MRLAGTQLLTLTTRYLMWTCKCKKKIEKSNHVYQCHLGSISTENGNAVFHFLFAYRLWFKDELWVPPGQNWFAFQQSKFWNVRDSGVFFVLSFFFLFFLSFLFSYFSIVSKRKGYSLTGQWPTSTYVRDLTCDILSIDGELVRRRKENTDRTLKRRVDVIWNWNWIDCLSFFLFTFFVSLCHSDSAISFLPIILSV